MKLTSRLVLTWVNEINRYKNGKKKYNGHIRWSLCSYSTDIITLPKLLVWPHNKVFFGMLSADTESYSEYKYNFLIYIFVSKFFIHICLSFYIFFYENCCFCRWQALFSTGTFLKKKADLFFALALYNRIRSVKSTKSYINNFKLSTVFVHHLFQHVSRKVQK